MFTVADNAELLKDKAKLAEEKAELKGEVNTKESDLKAEQDKNKKLTDELEQFKSSDTAVLLYEKKYQDERALKEQKDEEIKEKTLAHDKLQEQDLAKSKTISELSEAMKLEGEKNSQQQALIDEMQHEIAKLKSMLEKKDSHKVMVSNITN